MFPAVPPERATAGPAARHVLSRDEHDLFAETWARWATAFGELTPSVRQELEVICMETVLQFRLALLRKHLPPKRWTRRYHASCCRLQAARKRLGATRRQRLHGTLF
jgi:hypothetical protein